MKTMMRANATRRSFPFAGCLAGAVLAMLATNVTAQDGARQPSVYFGESGAADLYERSRCEDEQTIVYFSNGVKTTWTGALTGRERLDTRLSTYLMEEGLRNVFGDHKTAVAFHATSGSFWVDFFTRVSRDSNASYHARLHRIRAGLDHLSDQEQRREMAEALALDVQALRDSEEAANHAAAYDWMLDKGRANIVVGHSYGTILANLSYLGIEEHNRPGHALVQTALTRIIRHLGRRAVVSS